MWFSYLPQSYRSLSGIFFVIHATMYYRHLLVLAFLVNFAFYQQYVKIMFVNLCESKSEMPMYHIYSSNWCNPAYFAIFPEVTIARCSRKYLFLKHGREIRRAKFLEILEAAIFFQGLSCVNGYFFKFYRHIQKYAFFVVWFNM